MDRGARRTIAISFDRETSLSRLKSTSTTDTHTRMSRLTILGGMGRGGLLDWGALKLTGPKTRAHWVEVNG